MKESKRTQSKNVVKKSNMGRPPQWSNGWDTADGSVPMQGLRFNFWSENLIPLITTNVHMPQQKSKIPHVATKTELLNKLINQNKYSIIKINKFLKNLSFKKVRMAAIKISSNNKCWRGCREKGTLLHCWWECKLVQPLWRTAWRFLKIWK